MADEQRAWEGVIAHVERALLAGRLSPGDRLPGERVLAADLGVGRSSVREAIRVLEVLGLVRTSTGSGPSAGAVVVSAAGGGMSALMRLQLAATAFPVVDVVEMRLLLEGQVVSALAARSAHPDDAVAILDEMDDPRLTETAFLALDQRFHLALAETAGNAVLTATMTGLRSAIESYITAGARHVADWAATAARLRGEHRAIVSAVAAGDPLAAERAVRAHITGYYDEITIDTARLGHDREDQDGSAPVAEAQ